MKLLPWSMNNDLFEGYTVAGYQDGKLFDMQFHDDNDEEIIANRKRLAEALHTDLKHMVAPMQRHTTNFLKVSLNDGGRGITSLDDAFEPIDATYTRDTDLLLYTFHADCCPVLLYHESHLVAAIHSGWKGTVTQIVSKVVSYLIANENCAPEGFYAYIGPSLEMRNFEAMDDIIDQVKKMDFDTSSFYKKIDDKHYLLDSKSLILQQLLNLGVPRDHIEVSPYCTTEHEDLFFSYRKTKTACRNISIIRLKK